MKKCIKKILILVIVVIILIEYFQALSNKSNLIITQCYIDSNCSNEISEIPTKEEIIKVLCCDEFDGRAVGSNGNKLSQRYIIKLFKDANLEPFYYNTYEQIFLCNINNDKIYSQEKVSNIIGKISGKDNKKAIVLSAHFDHIGHQLNGEIVKGAIDNASGMSILIDMAKELKNKLNNIEYEYDIVFAAFNAEELGLVGSQVFANKIHKYYNDIYNINIDCVGYKNGGGIVLTNNYNKIMKVRGNEKYNYLYSNLKNSFENYGVTISNINEVTGLSDDFSFQDNGYTSISVIEENIFNIIHSSEDTPEVIDSKKLDLIEKSLIDFIIKFKFE